MFYYVIEYNSLKIYSKSGINNVIYSINLLKTNFVRVGNSCCLFRIEKGFIMIYFIEGAVIYDQQ